MKSLILSVCAVALLLSFLWYSGNPPTSAATPTVLRFPTNTFSITSTPTPNPKIAKLAERVVFDLHGTDMHDHDLRTSTGMIEGYAILTIFLGESEKGEREAIEQARHDYPILICDLIAAGFTEYISISGLVKLAVEDIEDEEELEEVPLIELVLDADILAKLNCADPAKIDIYKLPQPATYPAELAVYIPTMTPTLSPTPDPSNIAEKVVKDLHGTNIHDSDFRDSTSAYTNIAVLRIFLSQSEESQRAAIDQARNDYPILICDLLAKGFTERISITGLTEIDGEEQKTIEVALDSATLAEVECTYPSRNNIFAMADSLYIHPTYANFYFTATPHLTDTPRPTFTLNPDRALCGNATKCTEITSCEQAYACLRLGDGGLDADDDGVPCESICPGG